MGFQNLWVLSLWVASGITLFPYSDSWEQEVLGRVLSRYPFLMSWNYLSLCKTVFSTLLSNHPKQPLGNSLWTRTAWSDLVKLWVFFAYGVFCRLVPIYLTFCVWVLEVFCLWPPKYPGFFFFWLFSHSCLVLLVNTTSLRSVQYLVVTKMQTWAPQQDCLFHLLH